MKRTKKELKERKAKAAEIAAMYNTVSSGGRIQEANMTQLGIKWLESDGPSLSSDLSLFRVILAAPKKKP